MQAIQYDRYGPPEVLELREIDPPASRPGHVRVRVHSASLNPKDSLFRKGMFRAISGRRFPKMCGLDFAGTVLEGDDDFRVGDRVFGVLDEWRFRRGTLATEVLTAPREIAHLPDSASFEDAATLPLVGLTALQALRDLGRIEPGKTLLINGASGGVGTAAIQIAQLLGATVTTRSSPANFELCRSLGAQHTFDYREHELTMGGPYDAIFDVYGNLRFGLARQALTRSGVFVSTVPTARRVAKEVLSKLGARRERLVVIKPNRQDLEKVADWLAAGALRAVIDRRVTLSSVREGVERVESKRTRGKVLVAVDRP